MIMTATTAAAKGAHPLAGLRDLADGRHCGGDPQQKREEVREAAEEPSPKRSFGHPFDLVAAEPGEPSIGLCGVETAIAAAKPRQHLLRADCGNVRLVRPEPILSRQGGHVGPTFRRHS